MAQSRPSDLEEQLLPQTPPYAENNYCTWRRGSKIAAPIFGLFTLFFIALSNYDELCVLPDQEVCNAFGETLGIISGLLTLLFFIEGYCKRETDPPTHSTLAHALPSPR